MTRIFTEGAEMGDILFWDVAGNVTTETATPNPETGSGTYYYQLTGTATATKAFTAIDELYLRARIYVTAFNGVNRYPKFNSGITDLVTLRQNQATGKLEAWTNVLVGTSTTTLPINEWHLIEVYIKIADAPNGRFAVKLDANTEIDFTGDTLVTAELTMDNISFIKSSTSTDFYIDDLGMNDTAGGSDDSWLGNGQITSIYPNDNGTTNDWVGSDADSVDNYLLVDEVPNDGDTTYVYDDGADAGSQDQYDLTDTYTGTNRTITRIYTEARARKTAADAATVKLGILAAGGADDMSAARSLTTTYARYVGDEHTVNPVDAAAWEEADIDALELVLEIG